MRRNTIMVLVAVACMLGILVGQISAATATPLVPNGVSQLGQLKNLATGRCLDAPDRALNTNVEMNVCTVNSVEGAGAAETWEFPGVGQSGPIYSYDASLCVTRSSITSTAKQLVLQSCSSGPAALRTWTIHDLGVTQGKHYAWVGPAGGPVRMDADYKNAYSNVPNNGNYQKWILNTH
ncbi:MAG: hypothetical protein DLM57_03200 [Pseudonocardiales bacterium]|nr:MAG: hypothetical protein DLM57_03200 [Pseudonocardiales bacterium]